MRLSLVVLWLITREHYKSTNTTKELSVVELEGINQVKWHLSNRVLVSLVRDIYSLSEATAWC